MYKVKEILNLGNGMTVLVCELFDDSIITQRLKTNIGEFVSEQFVVERVTSCFGIPQSRNILLKNCIVAEPITSIEFI